MPIELTADGAGAVLRYARAIAAKTAPRWGWMVCDDVAAYVGLQLSRVLAGEIERPPTGLERRWVLLMVLQGGRVARKERGDRVVREPAWAALPTETRTPGPDPAAAAAARIDLAAALAAMDNHCRTFWDRIGRGDRPSEAAEATGRRRGWRPKGYLDRV